MAKHAIARRSEWWPDRMADWLDSLELPTFGGLRDGDRLLRIEEKRDGDTLVVRAEMPGIDPDKDVDIKVRDHTLEIRAERREESQSEEKGVRLSEFRYGSFFRAVSLPPDSKEGDVEATYKDGVLEVRVPCAPAAEEEPRRIPVSRG